jgi:hypothetical protein
MGSRKFQWTQAKYDRYIKEGRGKGEGKDYKPWITVRDVSSRGRSSRPPSWKTHREHHLLSDNEKRLFYLFEWSENITDIREQFPLSKIDLAMKIADEMGWKYPKDPETGISHVLTTDFMLTVIRNGQQIQMVRTVKMTQELEKQAIAERLEVERRYYLAEGIDWGVVTEEGIPRILAENIEWVHSAYWLEETTEMSIEELRSLAKILKFRLQESELTINQVTTALDNEHNIEIGTSLYLFRHLVARKEIVMDILNTKISSCPSAKSIQRII